MTTIAKRLGRVNIKTTDKEEPSLGVLDGGCRLVGDVELEELRLNGVEEEDNDGREEVDTEFDDLPAGMHRSHS
jgi:hypothetical protein